MQGITAEYIESKPVVLRKKWVKEIQKELDKNNSGPKPGGSGKNKDYGVAQRFRKD